MVAYDLAHAAAGVAIAGTALDYGALGDVEGRLACAFVADMVVDLATKVLGREADWGTVPGWSGPLEGFLATWRRPELLAGLCGEQGPRHLSEDFELVRTTFHRFAEEKVRPHAEHVHRSNDDVPEEIILGLGELGGFGLSVPESYGGFATGGESDYLGMVVATEELSWGSLAIGGSLMTRPEILTRALVTRRHRGPEAPLAPQAGHGRGPGRRRRDRTGLRLRRGGDHDLRHSRPRAGGSSTA